MNNATLDEGAALLAALGNAHTNDAQCTAEDRLLRWLLAHAAELLAAARQAQDNAKDAERYRGIVEHAEVIFYKTQEWKLPNGKTIQSRYPAPSEMALAVDAAITAATPGKGDVT